MKRFSRIALAAFLSLLAAPALAGPPFNVDDPQTTEKHHYGLLTYFTSSQVSGAEVQSFPTFQLTYGVTNNVEVDGTVGLISARTAGVGRTAGFGDILGAVRWRFKEETKRSPQLLVGYQIKLPTADPLRGLGTGRTDHALWLSAGKSFQRFFVFSNVGVNLLGAPGQKNNLFYGLGLTYQLTDKLIIGAQVYGNERAAIGARDELAWGGGLIYNFAPDRSLLLQIGKSEHDFSDLNVFAGVAFTFK